jgi:hypothetical protein
MMRNILRFVWASAFSVVSFAAGGMRAMDRPLRLMGAVLGMLLSAETDADRVYLFFSLAKTSPG